jgi:hypothetical protein
MKHHLLPPLLTAAVLAALAGAQSPSPKTDEIGRLQQLTRNRGLIQELVKHGLSLAAENDALKRADCCNGLARHLAQEIQQAAELHDVRRAAELGDHLCSLLSGGVAPNLTTVRVRTPLGSAGDIEMRRVGEDTRELTEPLEDLLGSVVQAEPGDLKRLLHSIRKARGEVENALKTRPNP